MYKINTAPISTTTATIIISAENSNSNSNNNNNNNNNKQNNKTEDGPLGNSIVEVMNIESDKNYVSFFR
jgi:hypothetical protein